MDPRVVATIKLLVERRWDARDAGTREYSAAQLDAIADFSWPWEGLQQAVVGGLQAIRAHWQRLGVRHDAPLPSRVCDDHDSQTIPPGHSSQQGARAQV